MEVNIVTIPIRPYSSGESKRAKTIPTKNVTPWLRNASAALHIVPFMVLSFKLCSAIKTTPVLSTHQTEILLTRQHPYSAQLKIDESLFFFSSTYLLSP